MIDFHSHILPCIDDGSGSVTESLAMLQEMRQQGTDTVCATPHFYASHISQEDFFNERSRSMEEIIAAVPADSPKLIPGAEFRYFSGMSRMKELEAFCLKDTGILLVEMPFCRWNEHMMSEIRELADYSGMTIMLAHYERYLTCARQGDFEGLKEHGVLIQSNAEHVLGLTSGFRAMKDLKNGFIDVLGSDAHNMTARRPNLGNACARIRKRAGDGFADGFFLAGEELLAKSGK